jgi:hypothetical protein
MIRRREFLEKALARRLCVALLLCAAFMPAQSAEVYEAAAVKAAFLYRFTGYVDWPPAALGKPVFTIAVLDSDAVAGELARLLPEHPVKDLPAQVRVIHSIREAAGAEMLYVGSVYTGNLHALIDSLGTRPVLVVTDRDGALDEGSAVNFLMVDRRVRYEISLTAAANAGLQVEPALLSVAVRVLGASHSGISCTATDSAQAADRSCMPRMAHS